MSDASGIAGADAKLWGLDRTLTRLMGGAGLALLLSWLLIDVIFGLHPYVSWWIWGHGLLAALFVVAVLSPSRVLTARTLKTLWVLIPAIGITLQITAFLAERSSDDAEVPGEATIWQVTWMLTAVYLSLLTMLLARAGDATTAHLLVRVNLIAAALALAPALSVWVEYGKLTPGLVSVTVVQFGNVSFAILLVLFRARMVPYFVVQERWQRRTSAVAAAEARLVEERELARLAHDNVLGALNSAAMWPAGETERLPTPVIDMASDALRAMDARAATRAASQSLGVARHIFVRTATRLGVEDVELGCDEDGALVPGEVIEALADAMSEAIRNSTRHSSGRTTRVSGSALRDEIHLTVSDEGPGFDPATVPPHRLGIRESIVGRLSEISGAEASIDSSPGSGTRVHLTWRRPSRNGEGRS